MQNFVCKKYCSNNTTTRVGLHLFLLSETLRSSLAQVQSDTIIQYNNYRLFVKYSRVMLNRLFVCQRWSDSQGVTKNRKQNNTISLDRPYPDNQCNWINKITMEIFYF